LVFALGKPTLVAELLVVVAIIAIIAVITVIVTGDVLRLWRGERRQQELFPRHRTLW
jgi:Tfp pilus assembly protein FimT